MATTTLQRYVRFGPATIDALDPCDAGMCGRALSNLNHLADQYAQARVNQLAPAGEYLAASAKDPDVWGRVWTSTPFDIHVRADGSSYRARVRLRVSSASDTWTATFRAVLSPLSESASERDVAGPNVGEVSSTSSALAWEAPASLLYLDGPRVGRALREVATVDEVAGPVRTALWLRCNLAVWAKRNNVGATPRLSGVYLAEYMP